MTRSSKLAHKDKLATVIKVLASKVRVEFTEGPAKGDTKDFPKDRVELVLGGQQEAPTAGTKRKDPAANMGDAEAKMLKAKELFGELSDVERVAVVRVVW